MNRALAFTADDEKAEIFILIAWIYHSGNGESKHFWGRIAEFAAAFRQPDSLKVLWECVREVLF